MLDGRVSFRSSRGRIWYEDSRDHFENGLLRLLHLDEAAFRRWIEAADQEDAPTALEALGRAFQRLNPLGDAGAAPTGPTSVENGPGGERGRLWLSRVAESPAWGIARAEDGSLAWLVRPTAEGWVREQQPPVYEEAYFEGDALKAGGYGDYGAQSGWRLEKAHRQINELQAVFPLPADARVLDVGSGYGFFRRALQEKGIANDGLEVSAHARAVAAQLYGQTTDGGMLAEKVSAWRGRFDLITLWDMIEHVDAPATLLADVAACLRPGGAVAIKTPNIDCPEAEVFGAHYHSLKREHLVYFGAAGLHAAGRAAGLVPLATTTTSHLLIGFVGAEETKRWASSLRGADLTVVLTKPGGQSPALHPPGRSV
jgi:2-polyprenyl-3-methyl-5-hydroxy-6-metoxy-1,4-benzoquinol methylase